MSEYITVQEAAIKWDISIRRVQTLCSTNRIQGVIKHGNVWFIPANAIKPEKKQPGVHINKDLRVLSLFSGCGGMDLGFEGGFKVLKRSVNMKIHPNWKVQNFKDRWVKLPETRFKTIFANDIRPDAKSAWVNYFSKKGVASSVYCLDSIVDLVKLHKENSLNIFPSKVDVITGGFPCQDFSIAGKRMGFNSTKSHLGKNLDDDEPSVENRGKLYIWMKEVISIVQPKLFIAENVKGLVNLEDVKKIIEKDFSNAAQGGYLVIPAKVLHAADYGVPQNRERVIFFGFKKEALLPKALQILSRLSSLPINDERQQVDSEWKKLLQEYDPYPVKTHNYTQRNENPVLNFSKCQLEPFVTVFECLYGLSEPEKSKDISQQRYSHAKYMGKHCQGQTEIDLDNIGPTIRSEHHGNIEFRRLSREHGGKHEEELRDGLQERRLTIRECARIQTFPDDYEFILPAKNGNKAVSASDAYKIIGNAVPPLLAFNIAKRIEENWEKYFGV